MCDIKIGAEHVTNVGHHHFSIQSLQVSLTFVLPVTQINLHIAQAATSFIPVSPVDSKGQTIGEQVTEFLRTCGTHSGGERCLQGFRWEARTLRDHWEDLGIGGRITLRWTLGR
jgi:hypothetical protein